MPLTAKSTGAAGGKAKTVTPPATARAPAAALITETRPSSESRPSSRSCFTFPYSTATVIAPVSAASGAATFPTTCATLLSVPTAPLAWLATGTLLSLPATLTMFPRSPPYGPCGAVPAPWIGMLRLMEVPTRPRQALERLVRHAFRLLSSRRGRRVGDRRRGGRDEGRSRRRRTGRRSRRRPGGARRGGGAGGRSRWGTRCRRRRHEGRGRRWLRSRVRPPTAGNPRCPRQHVLRFAFGGGGAHPVPGHIRQIALPSDAWRSADHASPVASLTPLLGRRLGQRRTLTAPGARRAARRPTRLRH